MNSILTPTAPAYLRAPEAAQYLNISLRTLRGWERRGIVRVIKPTRRCNLYRRTDLDAAMDRFAIGGKV